MGRVDRALWDNREKAPAAIEAELRGPKGREWLLRWLPTRAHDNGVFLVFANGVGPDDDEVRTGNSMIIDPYGRILSETWKAAEDMVAAGSLTPRATGALSGFLSLIREQRGGAQELELADLTAQVVEASGLPEHYEKAKDGKGVDRVENLEELAGAMASYDGMEDGLRAFLDRTALLSETDNTRGSAGVRMMTLHAAKGLEFPVVFIVGCEEGLLPFHFSGAEEDEIEEERRLFFVGMTRARRRLVLTHARERRVRGSVQESVPSPFLAAIEEELLERSTRAAHRARARRASRRYD